MNLQIELEPHDILTKFANEPAAIKTKIIFLGYTLYQDSKEYLKSWTNEEFSSKLKELQEELQKRSLQFKEDLFTTTQEVKEKTSVKYVHEIKDLETQIQEYKRELGNIRDSMEDKYEKRIDTLRSQYETKLETEREKYMKHMTIHENSSIKGQQGELYTFHQLNLLFPKFTIQDTHSEDARGDFLVHADNLLMMVEAKQYSKNVPLVEIEKFHRDMKIEANNDVKCGVLISLDSGICNKEDFSMEFIGGKPIIYLHHTREHMEHIRLALTMFQIILRQESLDTIMETATATFKQISKKLKRNFNKQKKQIDKFRSDQLQSLCEQQESIGELYQEMNLKIQF